MEPDYHTILIESILVLNPAVVALAVRTIVLASNATQAYTLTAPWSPAVYWLHGEAQFRDPTSASEREPS